jgi:hypothetical protein
MRPRHAIPVLGLVVVLAVGATYCVFRSPEREAAFCSDAGTCPPDQVCSAEDMCLRKCPKEDCIGTGCGCNSGDSSGGNAQGFCWEDGLCHFKCMDNNGCGCPSEGQVGQDQLCHPRCGDQKKCPLGMACHPNMNYCYLVAGDGGVGDGRVPEAGVGDGGGGDAGTKRQCNGGLTDVSSDPNNCGAATAT